MAGETPPRSSRQGNNSPLSPSDLTAARTAVEEAYKLIGVTDIDDTEGMAQRNQTYQEAMAAYSQLKAAVEANASAAAAAAAADILHFPPLRPGAATLRVHLSSDYILTMALIPFWRRR